MKREEFATAVGVVLRTRKRNVMRMLLCATFFTLHPSLFTSCSESADESADEYANWQQRNEAYFATLEDSLSRDPGTWTKVKTFTKDEDVAGEATDYVYVKMLEAGTSSDRPMYTDSVRISYRGRLIPTVSYQDGYVFDQTYSGAFHWETTAVSDALVSSFVDGFTTALLHMHRGDYCRVYIPYQLGYRTSASGSVPAYSTLIFDLALIDIGRAGQKFPTWSSRRSDSAYDGWMPSN